MELLADLDDLLGEEVAEDRAEDALDLVEEIEKWISEEQLDGSSWRDAIRVLQPVAGEGA